MRYSAVIFDIGNTLVSYPLKMRWPGMLQEALAAVSVCLASSGGHLPPQDILRQRAEDENHESGDYSVRPLAGRLARIYDINEENPVMRELELRFSKYLIAVGVLYADTLPVLAELCRRGYRLGAVSNLPWGCPSAPWREELTRLGVAEYLEAAVYCADTGWRKPAAQPFLKALLQMGLNASECVFVGDDPRWDLAGPRALGMPVVLLDRTEQLDMPDECVIHNLRELLSLV
ncbi:MAG: HAD family hydrolase [Chloroflexi bacterium]|nr:HAD family hydrolase [Chloroflexota bacterium]